MGSHGPAYFKRYPKNFSKYKPACRTAELSECTQEEIINAYDNSIRYTDFFLSKVIDLLIENTGHDTTMLYLSDHGESLGEGGLYLHGLPYSFAPAAQTQIPVIVWAGPTSRIDYSATNKLKHTNNSHDSVFGTLITLFDLKISIPLTSEKPVVVMKKTKLNESST
jgi:lipid A ethanolaminephosphotransferase